MRVREHDPLQVGRLAAEPPDRVEHAAGIVLEERVDERELPVRLDQVGADTAALLGAEHVHAGSELSHADTRVHGAKALSTPRSAGASAGIVPQQHVAHARLVDPVEPGLRVRLRVVVAREEAVALQPPRRHQDEDAEGRVAEAESLRQRLGVEPDHQVDLLDVAVHIPQLRRPGRVVRQLLERGRRLQVEEAPELVVAGHAALADPEHVDRREVDDGAVRLVQLLQEARVVVQGDRAGVRDPERVERVDEADLVEAGADVSDAELAERPLLQDLVRLDRAEGEVVGEERVHPIDGDELLGQRVRHAVVVGRRAGNAAEDLVRASLAEPLAEDPVPVRPHSVLRRRVRDDRRASTRPCGSSPSAPP